MNEPKYLQHEPLIAVFGLLIFCAALIWWVYSSDKKREDKLAEKGEKVDSYTKSFSWRVYIIAGTGLAIMIWELGKRFFTGFF